MRSQTTGVRVLPLFIAALQLAGCSRTVEWEEEVPLNTGEVIWVKRSVIYSLRGAGGNPLDIGYRPNYLETITFQWGGKKYVYAGDADLILLAISPQKVPVLVAPASNKSWDWNHNYYCATPHYVQFVPDASGRAWTWPPQVEPWLYGLSNNLMSHRGRPEEMYSRYTAQQRSEADAIGLMQAPSAARVDPKFVGNTGECKRRD